MNQSKLLSILTLTLTITVFSGCSNSGGDKGTTGATNDASNPSIPAPIPNGPQAKNVQNEIQGIYDDLAKLTAEGMLDINKAVADYYNVYNTYKTPKSLQNARTAQLLKNTFNKAFPALVNSLPAVEETLANGGEVKSKLVDIDEHSESADIYFDWVYGVEVFDNKSAPAMRRQSKQLAAQLVNASAFTKKGTKQSIRLMAGIELRALRYELSKVSNELKSIEIDPSIHLAGDRDAFVNKVNDFVAKIDKVLDFSSDTGKFIAGQMNNLSDYVAEVKKAADKERAEREKREAESARQARESARLAKAKAIGQNKREADIAKQTEAKNRANTVDQNKARAEAAEKGVALVLSENGKYFDWLVELKKAEKLYEKIVLINVAYQMDPVTKTVFEDAIKNKNSFLELNSKNVKPEDLHIQAAKNQVAKNQIQSAYAALDRLRDAARDLKDERSNRVSLYKDHIKRELVRIESLKSGDAPSNDPTEEELSQYDNRFNAVEKTATARVDSLFEKEWQNWATALVTKGATTDDVTKVLPSANRLLGSYLAKQKAEAAAQEKAAAEAEAAAKKAGAELVAMVKKASEEKRKIEEANEARKEERVAAVNKKVEEKAAEAERKFNEMVEELVKPIKDQLAIVFTSARKVALVGRQFTQAEEDYLKLNPILSADFTKVSGLLDVQKELEDRLAKDLEIKIASKIAQAKVATGYCFDEVKEYSLWHNFGTQFVRQWFDGKWDDYNTAFYSDGTKQRVAVIVAEARDLAMKEVPPPERLYLEAVIGTGKEISAVSDFYSQTIHRTLYSNLPEVRIKNKTSESQATEDPVGKANTDDAAFGRNPQSVGAKHHNNRHRHKSKKKKKS